MPILTLTAWVLVSFTLGTFAGLGVASMCSVARCNQCASRMNAALQITEELCTLARLIVNDAEAYPYADHKNIVETSLIDRLQDTVDKWRDFCKDSLA